MAAGLTTGQNARRSAGAVAAALVCAALAAACTPAADVRRSAASAPVPLPAAGDPARCLDEIAGTTGSAAHAALVIACTEGATADPATLALREDATRAIVRAAFDRDARQFRAVALAPNIAVSPEGMPAGTLAPAETYGNGGPRGPGIVPGRGVPMVLARAEGGDGAHQPPGGLLEPAAVTVRSRRTGGTLTVDMLAVTGPALRQGRWVNPAGQAFLRMTETARMRDAALVGFVDPGDARFPGDGIYLVEPYDPNRIPLLMIHGLRATPEVWTTLTLAVLTDPDLHRRFQVWHAFYPTGLPPLYSAAQVRQRLRAVLQRFDPAGTHAASRRIAVLGHSMGGIIARALVTDDGGALWRTAFRVPPERLAAPEGRLAVLRTLLTLTPEPPIGFVGFFNTPHRGSRAAAGPLGHIGSALIRLPVAFTALFTGDPQFQAQIADEMRPVLGAGNADSVRSLTPGHPLLLALDRLPPAPGVRVVSVIGVHGGAACLRQPGCHATDGLVSHASARLPYGAELVVDGGHDGHSHPDAIAFLRQELLDWASRP